ncbi:hypothetical protein TNCV_1265091 [Trichonephila clavipes]|nr:hypothetical protein TNCV_1265091 [Trichonephila clavipes]
MSDRGPRKLSQQGARVWRLSLTVALSTIQVTVRFDSVPPFFEGEHPDERSGASCLSSSSINLSRLLAPLRKFRVPLPMPPPAVQVLYVDEHRCPPRDSITDPTTQQSTSL